MEIFSLFKRQPNKVKGLIGYYELTDWWLSVFTDVERDYIIKRFQPLGSSGDSLTKDNITSTSQSEISFLSTLSTWFKKTEDQSIGFRLIYKAELLITNSSNILDLHFLYQAKIELYYRLREIETAFGEAISACKKQIEISQKAKDAFKKEYKHEPLPSHKGYEQLVIIEEKRNNFKEAIDISKKALKEGWSGDWEHRIERCQKKIYKLREKDNH